MDEPKSSSPLLFTPQIPAKRKGYTRESSDRKSNSILRTPSIPEYNKSRDTTGSSSKKRVRLSTETKVISSKERRLYSPFESFSQMTPCRLSRRFSNQKKKFRIKRLSLDALLDPDVQPIWSSEMATPPKSGIEKEQIQEECLKINDPVFEESPKKGVARTLFKETSLQQELNDTIPIDNSTDGDIAELPASPSVITSYRKNPLDNPSPSCLPDDNIDQSLSPCLHITPKVKSIDELISKDSLLDQSSFIDVTLSPSVASLNVREDKRKTLDYTNSSGFASMENTRTVDPHEEKPSAMHEPVDMFLSPPIVASNKKKHVTWSISTDMKILSQSTPIVTDHAENLFFPLADSLEEKTKISSSVTQRTFKGQNRKLDFQDDLNKTSKALRITLTNIDAADVHIMNLNESRIPAEMSCAVVPSQADREVLSDGAENFTGFDLSPPISTVSINTNFQELSQALPSKESLNHGGKQSYEQSPVSPNKNWKKLDSDFSPTVPSLKKPFKQFPSPGDPNYYAISSPVFDNISKSSLLSDSTDSLINVSGTLLQDLSLKNKASQEPLPENYKDLQSFLTFDICVDTKIGVNKNTETMIVHNLKNHGPDNSKEKSSICGNKNNILTNFHYKSNKQCIGTKSKQFLYPTVKSKRTRVPNFDEINTKEVGKVNLKSLKKEQGLEQSTKELLQHLKASESIQSSNKHSEQVLIDMDELTQIYSQDLHETIDTHLEYSDISKRKSLESYGKKLLSLNDQNATTYESFNGFQTGLLKQVEISEESLKATKKFFAEDDVPVTSSKSYQGFQGFQTSLGKQVEISKESLKAAKKFLADDDVPVTSSKLHHGFQGFQTGLGKQVEISEKSLKAAKKLFAEDDVHFRSSNTVNGFQGFQTGLGKQVEITEESLKAAKKILTEDHVPVTSSKSHHRFQGFQTGLGKQIEISEESLKAAKKLLAEDDVLFTSSKSHHGFQGFQTGLGKQIEISEESLKAAKKLLAEDDVPFTSSKSVSAFQGFQTDLGKQIEISEESLKAAKKVLAEDDVPVTSTKSHHRFQGFQTGLGKQVEISEKSMKAAKKLFAEDDDPVTSSKSHQRFQGFQTDIESLKVARNSLTNKSMASRSIEEESNFDLTSTKGQSSSSPYAVSLQHHQVLRSSWKKKVLYTSPAAYQFDRDASLSIPLRSVCSSPDSGDTRRPHEGKEQQHKSLFVTPFKSISKDNKNEKDITPNVTKDKCYSFYPLGRKRLKLSNAQKSISGEGPQLLCKDGRLYTQKKKQNKKFC